MSWESFDVVGFDLGALLQGQSRIAQLKSAYNSLIIGRRDLDGKPLYRKSLAGNLLVLTDLTFSPPLQGQTRIAKLKSAYNLLIIDPRGLQCATNSYEILG